MPRRDDDGGADEGKTCAICIPLNKTQFYICLPQNVRQFYSGPSFAPRERHQCTLLSHFGMPPPTHTHSHYSIRLPQPTGDPSILWKHVHFAAGSSAPAEKTWARLRDGFRNVKTCTFIIIISFSSVPPLTGLLLACCNSRSYSSAKFFPLEF